VEWHWNQAAAVTASRRKNKNAPRVRDVEIVKKVTTLQRAAEVTL